jgi:hypothetical protein
MREIRKRMERVVMDHRRPVIHSIAETQAFQVKLLDSAASAPAWLHSFTGAPLNVVEQLNQTFTILVTLRADERLIELLPDAEGFRFWRRYQ